MKHGLLALALLVIGLTAWQRLSGAMDDAPALSPKAQLEFEWFSKLGFRDVQRLPFVQVKTWYGDSQAFLVSTNAGRFTVFTMDLLQSEFVEDEPSQPSWRVVGSKIVPSPVTARFTRLNLREETHRLLRELKNPIDRDYFEKRFGRNLSGRAEVFVLAWACWRQGLNVEAQQLYDRAPRISHRYRSNDPKEDFHIILEKDLGVAMATRAMDDFRTSSIGRPELLRRIEAILRDYPHCEPAERLRSMVAGLKRMIPEDEAHARTAPKDLDGLPVEDRVRELIFRLRDQRLYSLGVNALEDLFGYDWGFPRDKQLEDSEYMQACRAPAGRLVEIGYPAVPQLIAALDDETLTRATRGRGLDPCQVLTVGRCAGAILERIAGRAFDFEHVTVVSGDSSHPEDLPRHFMDKNCDLPAVRKAIEAWWADFQKKGEKRMLVESVESGDSDSPECAKRLRQKYPGAETDALIKGASICRRPWTRCELIRLISESNDPKALEFLKKEMKAAPWLSTRVAAAVELRKRGYPEPVPAMIQEWSKVDPTIGHDRKQKSNSDLTRAGEVIEFLADSDSLDAIAALAKDFSKRHVDQRMDVIEALGKNLTCCRGFPNRRPSIAVLKASEEFLLAALSDTEKRLQYSGYEQGKSFKDPRICDVAARLLAGRWPERYTFDFFAPLDVRDRQRSECLKMGRKPHIFSDPPPSPVQPDKAHSGTDPEGTWHIENFGASSKAATFQDSSK